MATTVIVMIGIVLSGFALPRLAVGQPCAYVANLMSDSVSVIDTATNVVAATIPVGHNPNGIAVSRYSGMVCVTNFLSNDVSLIDSRTQTVAATVAVGAGPVGVARPPGGDLPDPDIPESFVYVGNKKDHSVSVVEVGTARVVATIQVDQNPDGVAVGASKVYVTHSVPAGSLSVIETATNSVVAKIPVGARPSRVAFTPDGRFAYVTNFGSFNVSVIDTATNAVTATIGLSLKPSDVAITPDGQSAYVTNFGAPIVSIIPVMTNAVIAAITVGAEPAAIAHIRNRGHAYTYVANSRSDSVSVIDRAHDNNVVATIPVGHMPFAVAVGPGNCAVLPPASPTTTQSATVVPSLTPVATHTVTPTASTTSTSTATCTPTSTRTSTPTMTPNRNGGGGCAIDGAAGEHGSLPGLLLGVVLFWRRRRLSR